MAFAIFSAFEPSYLITKQDFLFVPEFHLRASKFKATTCRNFLHISLNFDPSDKPGKDKLLEIAAFYMQRIGFSHQPYVVYQHDDAGHTHLHIVTATIKNDGSRIDTFNIGRTQSEKARKEIELRYGLVVAAGKNNHPYEQIKPIDAQKVIYGKSETKRAITNVLDAVLNTYKYTSVAELNAVLKQYNVVADRGNEHSTIFKKGGIVYRILDEKGSKVGVPIKASSIYSKLMLNPPVTQPLTNKLTNRSFHFTAAKFSYASFTHRTEPIPQSPNHTHASW